MLPDKRHMIQTRYDEARKLQNAGKLLDAAQKYRLLLQDVPGVPEAHVQLARIAAAQGASQLRRDEAEAALKLRPNDPVILRECIAANTALSAHERVLELHDALIALAPRAAKPQADKALYLQRIGRFDESEKLFRKLLKKHPQDAELYRMFVATTKLRPNDPLIGAMRRLARHPRLTPEGHMHINFALAKALEDSGQYEKVFAHLHRANAAQGKLWPFDAAARDAETEAVLAAQEGLEPIADMPPGDPGFIFVTGLPRSGTTLAEQIIAAHSMVGAGGEMGIALKTAYNRFGAATRMKPLADLTRDDFLAFARDLSHAAAPFRGDTDRGWITDKSIMAFLIYGLLHRTLPNARFIVVHRDPRDIAVSIYKNHFVGGTHRYANDLSSIATTIKSFRRVIAHWRKRLPDRFAEFRYEDIVADPEGQSKRLIAAAGLPWEDRCLEFYKSESTVKTLSLAQVRKPIYKSSAQAWRRYEKDLQPFFDAWGDEPWD